MKSPCSLCNYEIRLRCHWRIGKIWAWKQPNAAYSSALRHRKQLMLWVRICDAQSHLARTARHSPLLIYNRWLVRSDFAGGQWRGVIIWSGLRLLAGQLRLVLWDMRYMEGGRKRIQRNVGKYKESISAESLSYLWSGASLRENIAWGVSYYKGKRAISESNDESSYNQHRAGCMA